MSAMTDLTVTGIGVAAPGIGVAADAATCGAPVPAAPDWFDPAAELGPRGHRYLPPASQYLLAAARRAVADAGDVDRVAAQHRGAVLATNGALSATYAAVDRTVSHGHADQLSPATAPYFAVNVVGSRLSSQYRLQAFTLTVTSPAVAGMEALAVGRRAIVAGRCRSLLAAAVEHAAGSAGAAAEQGAVVLLLRPRRRTGSDGYGYCRARISFLPPRLLPAAETRDRLRGWLGDWFSTVDPDRCGAVYPVLDDSPIGEAVADAVADPRVGGRVVCPPAPAGTGCLAPMLRMAGLLAAGAPAGTVLAASRHGNLGLAWFAGNDDPGRGSC